MIFRGLYTATNGDLYGVVDATVYYISPQWQFTSLGTITAGLETSTSMADNALVIMLVDGSSNGWSINMTTRVMTQIFDAAFYGSVRVDYVDTFFLLVKPGTGEFYVSPSEWVPGIAFDPLDIAKKTGYADNISSLVVMHREIWLVGIQTSEIWYDVGASDFAFQPMPGAFIEHGIAAKYSLAKYDISVFWLSQDLEGDCIVIRGTGYQAKRISTHAIENEIRQYSRIDDAIGFCYQQEGHAFYFLTFPTADKTWCYDLATELWHERAWMDSNGLLHRHRANCHTFAYGTNLVGDHANGNLYQLDLDTYNDDGDPILRLRSFPHLLDDGKRIFYRCFIADMEVGTDAGTTTDDPPMLTLRYSDTKGASWGNPIQQSMGSAGQYLTSIQFQRLGLARDRIFEISFSGDFKTALNGAFVDTKKAAT